jgi:hypothetical protein
MKPSALAAQSVTKRLSPFCTNVSNTVRIDLPFYIIEEIARREGQTLLRKSLRARLYEGGALVAGRSAPATLFGDCPKYRPAANGR